MNKILIIDDELLIRESLKRVFSKKGYRVEIASEGREGLKLWQDFNPDLVLLDYLMPNFTGLDVLNEMKSNTKCNIIVMSAFLGARERALFGELGVRFFIDKPFDDIHKLIDRVESILDGSES